MCAEGATGGVLSVSISAGGVFDIGGGYAASQASTDGGGSGATFTVTVAEFGFNDVVNIDSIDTPGTGYQVGDKIVLSVSGPTEFVPAEVEVLSVG